MNAPITHPYSSERLEWTLELPFEKVVRSLRRLLGHPSRLRLVWLVASRQKAALQRYLTKTKGEFGLMVLGSISHGRILGLFRGPRRAAMFLIGDPLTALGMMQVHPEAGLYAPLRLMFTETESGKTRMTCDRPSRLLAQWPEPVFASTGAMLDQKLDSLASLLAGETENTHG